MRFPFVAQKTPPFVEHDHRRRSCAGGFFSRTRSDNWKNNVFLTGESCCHLRCAVVCGRRKNISDCMAPSKLTSKHKSNSSQQSNRNELKTVANKGTETNSNITLTVLGKKTSGCQAPEVRKQHCQVDKKLYEHQKIWRVSLPIKATHISGRACVGKVFLYRSKQSLIFHCALISLKAASRKLC